MRKDENLELRTSIAEILASKGSAEVKRKKKEKKSNGSKQTRAITSTGK